MRIQSHKNIYKYFKIIEFCIKIFYTFAALLTPIDNNLTLKRS